MGGFDPSYGYADPSWASVAVASGQIVSVLASSNELGGGNCKATVKIFVPLQTPLGESRGKLLGSRGSTLKQLVVESGCQVVRLPACPRALSARGPETQPPAET